MTSPALKIAIIGGGPSALFIVKRLLESGRQDFTLDIFEAGRHLGHGMPYSPAGAGPEHVTNVSENELPPLPQTLGEWIAAQPRAALASYGIQPEEFTTDRVVPRLLFGVYLEAQFERYLDQARQSGIDINVHFQSRIEDVTHANAAFTLSLSSAPEKKVFDSVIICSGHNWPKKLEGKVSAYFDSPYPPDKLRCLTNCRVALRGSSLTAIDAVRTVARANGEFIRKDNRLIYDAATDSPDFKLTMYSKHGLLPCVRFFLEDPLVSLDAEISEDEIQTHRKSNNGYVALDYLFDVFKSGLVKAEPSLKDALHDASLESFVENMMAFREGIDPFALFKAEYAEAKKSFADHRSIRWKEHLASLSFLLNFPAKHMSAEDMLRLKQVLSPLIAVVIAFVPPVSTEELIALHDAGRLDLIAVDAASHVEALPDGDIAYHRRDDAGHVIIDRHNAFVDSIGQPPLEINAFPFPGLVSAGLVTQAFLNFREPGAAREALQNGNREVFHVGGDDYRLRVSGLSIGDDFDAVGADGSADKRLYIMAVPYIGGYNPDYSGLDFCEETSKRIVAHLLS